MAVIQAICISEKKGTVKQNIPKATLKTDWGIVGDAHAGNWHRQVSLLAGERIDTMKALVPGLKDGAFAENLITRGIDLRTLGVGSRLALGDSVLLEITQIGKECHQGCAIRKLTGDCIMPREGLFARVLEGGVIEPGAPVRIVTRIPVETVTEPVGSTPVGNH